LATRIDPFACVLLRLCIHFFGLPCWAKCCIPLGHNVEAMFVFVSKDSNACCFIGIIAPPFVVSSIFAIFYKKYDDNFT
jgi:hypothetical protein